LLRGQFLHISAFLNALRILLPVEYTVTSIMFSLIGSKIQIHFVADILEELKVTLTTIWWLHKFRRDYQYLSKWAMQNFSMDRLNKKL
jgi:hypothetical protein